MVDNPSRTVVPFTRLFVRRRGKDHIAIKRHPLSLEQEKYHELGGDHIFHIQRTAPPYVAVNQCAGEGRMRPVFWFDGDDIGMPKQHQRFTVAPRKRGQHVAPARFGLHKDRG